jgi:hypothetical protein
MLRALLAERSHKPDDIRWRGGEVTRLEGFSDAVFGFALTLLVVSLEVPRTFDQLKAMMAGAPSFAMAFLIFSMIWYRHYVFFRRYGLQDNVTVVLNAILLFTVALYVYPLKFYFNLAFATPSHRAQAVQDATGAWSPMMRPEQLTGLILVFVIGLCVVFLIFGLLYLHAYRRRGVLELSEREAFDTLSTARRFFYFVGAGLIVIPLAVILPPPWKWFALWGLFSVWIFRSIDRKWVEARRPAQPPPDDLSH